MQKEDPTAASRKRDHIELAFASQTREKDDRFFYEPLFSGNTPDVSALKCNFSRFTMGAPIWISSMTGGTDRAKNINRNLAMLCGEFGLGMGLGSCRSLLYSNDVLDDFDVRPLMGDRPLYANLGVAQVENLLKEGAHSKITELVSRLNADGLIVHINPLQEWFQPEGDRYTDAPIDTIARLLDKTKLNLIVKEVGHGFGPASLEALMNLPLDAIEFAAFGGTNFSKLEMLRDTNGGAADKAAMAFVGHTAAEMVDFVNQILESRDVSCKSFILSGGISSFLDGAWLADACRGEAIYGQASAFLKHALGDYELLKQYAVHQLEGLALAKQLLVNKKVNKHV